MTTTNQHLSEIEFMNLLDAISNEKKNTGNLQRLWKHARDCSECLPLLWDCYEARSDLLEAKNVPLINRIKLEVHKKLNSFSLNSISDFLFPLQKTMLPSYRANGDDDDDNNEEMSSIKIGVFHPKAKINLEIATGLDSLYAEWSIQQMKPELMSVSLMQDNELLERQTVNNESAVLRFSLPVEKKALEFHLQVKDQEHTIVNIEI